MRVKNLQENDVIRFYRTGMGSCIGIVVRTYESGGKAGASVVGKSDNGLFMNAIIKDGDRIELLWRGEEKAR